MFNTPTVQFPVRSVNTALLVNLKPNFEIKFFVLYRQVMLLTIFCNNFWTLILGMWCDIKHNLWISMGKVYYIFFYKVSVKKEKTPKIN